MYFIFLKYIYALYILKYIYILYSIYIYIYNIIYNININKYKKYIYIYKTCEVVCVRNRNNIKTTFKSWQKYQGLKRRNRQGNIFASCVSLDFLSKGDAMAVCLLSINAEHMSYSSLYLFQCLDVYLYNTKFFFQV